MSLVASNFKSFFTEFSNETDERISILLNNAKLRVSQKVFGDTYQLAVFYLAAHMLATDNNNTTSGGTGTGNKGAVASEKVGDLSISYSNINASPSSSNSSAQYLETSYGRTFVQLRKEKVLNLSIANKDTIL